MNLFILFFWIILLFLFTKIDQIESVNKKLQQKSFDEIFGEKWEEKGAEKLEEKRKIIEKYFKIKEKIKQKERKYSAKEWAKIEGKISKKLGTNRQYIYKWIKQLGLNQKIQKSYKSTTDEQKLVIVQKFIEMKKEYKQKSKYSHNEWHQNYAEICQKIGVSRETIRKWKKQFGINKKKLTEKEKMEKMKIYWQIKRENPKISDKKIAQMFGIDRTTISKWKKHFGEE